MLLPAFSASLRSYKTNRKQSGLNHGREGFGKDSMNMHRAKWCSMMGSVLALLLVAGQLVWAGPPKPEDLKKVEAALPATAQVQPLKPRKLLVFTRTTGFRHSSIELGAEAIRLMCE